MCWTLYSRELVETPPWRSYSYGRILIQSISRLLLLSCNESDHNWSCVFFKTNIHNSWPTCMYYVVCTFTQVQAKCFLYFIYYLYWAVHSGDVQPNHAQYRVIWDLGIACICVCTWGIFHQLFVWCSIQLGSIMYKTGKVSSPVHTCLWVGVYISIHIRSKHGKYNFNILNSVYFWISWQLTDCMRHVLIACCPVSRI